MHGGLVQMGFKAYLQQFGQEELDVPAWSLAGAYVTKSALN